MSRPILCIGTYAKEPYNIERIGRNVYCIEELCYCLVQNAFLLDEESFDRELYDWIDRECSLTRLADELRGMAAKRCSMASIAGTILDYVGYNSKEEVDRTEEILRENAGMDIYKKRLARAEFLMNNTPDIDRVLRARIEHNEGVMYAKLFLFDMAAKMFARAYEHDHNYESYLQYLSAVRMGLTDKEYISFIAENEDAYEASLELEKRMNEASELYAAGEENLMLKSLLVYKAEGKMHEYYEKVGSLTEELKEDYRFIVKEKTVSR